MLSCTEQKAVKTSERESRVASVLEKHDTKRHQSPSPPRKAKPVIESEDPGKERKSRKSPEKRNSVASEGKRDTQISSPKRLGSKTQTKSLVKAMPAKGSKAKRHRSSSDTDDKPRNSDKNKNDKASSRKGSLVTKKSKKVRDSSPKEKKKKKDLEEESEKDSKKSK